MELSKINEKIAKLENEILELKAEAESLKLMESPAIQRVTNETLKNGKNKVVAYFNNGDKKIIMKASKSKYTYYAFRKDGGQINIQTEKTDSVYFTESLPIEQVK